MFTLVLKVLRLELHFNILNGRMKGNTYGYGGCSSIG